MKKIFLTIFWVLAIFNLYAQDNINDIEKLRELIESTEDSLDIADEKKVEPGVVTWRLINNGVNKQFIQTDTFKMDVQITNPIYYDDNISNSFLGNLGSPSESKIFNNRQPLRNDFLFLNTYKSYIHTPQNNLFFNTRTPYTSLNYSHSGRRKDAEDHLNILHSRNINPYWNMGFVYNIIHSKGNFIHQKSKVYDFAFQTSFEKNRYNGYFFITKNQIDTEENGGLEDDALLVDSNLNVETILVNFEDMETNSSNFHIATSHHYNFGKPKRIFQNNDSINAYPIKLVYTFRREKNKRKHFENTINNEFFDTTYTNGTTYFDIHSYKKTQNSLHLVINHNYFKWFKYGLNASIHHEKFEHGFPVIDTANLEVKNDSLQESFSNTYFSIGTFNTENELINWNISVRSYVEGYRKGNWEIDGLMNFNIGKNNVHNIQISSKSGTYKPNYLLNNYSGNHQFWKNDFENEKKLKFNVDYTFKKWNLKTGFAYDAVNNYIYFNDKAIPQQHTENINVLMAYIKGTLKFWKFNFDQTVYYQKSKSEDIIPLPEISLYSNNYFESHIFKKAALIRLGADIRYYKKYFAPAYMPSTGQFHLQTEKEIGNHPEVNIYLSARIKKTRLFFMYSHFSADIGTRDYFSTLHYPIQPSGFRWGLKWHFFD